MASTTAQAPVQNISLRLARSSPAVVTLVGALLSLLGVALVELVGEPRHQPSRFFLFMMPAYVVALAIVLRGALSALDALPMLAAQTQEAFRAELCRLPLRWIAVSQGFGIGVHLTIAVIAGVPLFRPVSAAPGDVLVFAAAWPHIVVVSFTWAVILRQGWLFLKLGRAVDRVDLLDPTSFAPFVQVALRPALLIALMTGASIAFHVDWRELSVAPQIALTLPVALLVQGLVFAFPLWGVHTRLRDERAAELARVNAAIRGDRSALRDSLVAADAASLSTPEMLLYRSQVEAFPTWPFGTRALLRLALYGVIPVLGWVAAALVERVVDLALGGSG